MTSDQTLASSPARASTRLALAMLLLIAVAYIVCLLLLPHDAAQFWTPDEGGKFIQLQNIRWNAGPDIHISYPGRVLDGDFQFVPFPPRQWFIHDNRLFLQWPPFLPLLAWLPYKLLGVIGLYLIPLVAGLLTCWLAYLLTRWLLPGAGRAWLVIPLLGLSTPLAVYSLVYFEHSLAALLVLLAIYALLVHWQDWRWQLLGGLVLAVAIWLRSELYILALVLLGVLMLRAVLLGGWQRLGVWAGGLIGGLIPLWLFYIFTWGSLLPAHATPYFSSGLKVRFIAAGGIRTFLGSFLLGVPDDLTALPDLGPHLTSAWRYTFLIGLALFLLGALLHSGWQRDALLLLGLTAIVLTSFLLVTDSYDYASLHGFLLPAPLLAIAVLLIRSSVFAVPPPVFSVAGWGEVIASPPISERGKATAPTAARAQVRRGFSQQLVTLVSNPLAMLATITGLYIIAHTLIISTVSGLGPDSRFEWGQRYLLPAYPLVAILVVAALPRLWLGKQGDTRLRIGGSLLRDLLTFIVFMGIIAGVGLEVRGVAAVAAARKDSAAWIQTVRQTTRLRPNVAVVSNVWWLPLRIPALYGSRRLFVAEDDTALAAFVKQIAAKGETDFYLLTTNPQPPAIAGAQATSEIAASTAGVEMIRYQLKTQRLARW